MGFRKAIQPNQNHEDRITGHSGPLCIGRACRRHRHAGRRFHQRHVHRPHRRRRPRLHSTTQEQGGFPRHTGHDGEHPQGHGTHPPPRRGRRRRPEARGDDRRPDARRTALPPRSAGRILGRHGLHRRHGDLQQGRFAVFNPSSRTSPNRWPRRFRVSTTSATASRSGTRRSPATPQAAKRTSRPKSAGSRRAATRCSLSGRRSNRA